MDQMNNRIYPYTQSHNIESNQRKLTVWKLLICCFESSRQNLVISYKSRNFTHCISIGYTCVNVYFWLVGTRSITDICVALNLVRHIAVQVSNIHDFCATSLDLAF